tara:strand:- start:780 stop:1550 length:771 start_codon:yes stop_codon:yes gene_type:complete
MWNFVYYLAYASSAAATAYGVLYVYDKKTAQDIIRTVSWNAVKAYHKINLEINNLKRQYGFQKPKYTKVEKKDEDEKNLSSDDEDSEEILPRLTFIGYTNGAEEMWPTLTTSNLDNNEEISTMSFNLMYVKETKEGKDYFKRIENKNILCNDMIIESIEKPFLQVEISQIDVEGGSQRTSIHKYLEHFYVEGNKLFDKNFLKWYLQEYYAIELGGNYILHIIDTDINMFELKPNEFIKLKNKKEQNKLYTVMNTTE